MSAKIKIEIVSDVVCPWCIIGYKRLEKAIEELDVKDKIEIEWQPFQLNPTMSPEGKNALEYMSNKYTKLAEEADKAFNGDYSEELNDLVGLSKEELESVIPDTQNKNTYKALIKIVEQASKENTKQADLINNIKELGEVAVNIAKKVPGLKNLI